MVPFRTPIWKHLLSLCYSTHFPLICNLFVAIPCVSVMYQTHRGWMHMQGELNFKQPGTKLKQFQTEGKCKKSGTHKIGNAK